MLHFPTICSLWYQIHVMRPMGVLAACLESRQSGRAVDFWLLRFPGYACSPQKMSNKNLSKVKTFTSGYTGSVLSIKALTLHAEKHCFSSNPTPRTSEAGGRKGSSWGAPRGCELWRWVWGRWLTALLLTPKTLFS